ncbi:MAG: hypothetical protein DCF20_05400 [Pseudanabaena sp.]|nr:MAG: hypothetical protein DCF20_05400 [Pseudanabaena sp.]
MTQNPLAEQAKQGNVKVIAFVMNRLLRSQAMLANVERVGDSLEILIESDRLSLNDEIRIPDQQVLMGILKKLFVTLEVKEVSKISVSWQQTGFDEPAWTEEIYIVEQDDLSISENGGIIESTKIPRIPPLPLLPLNPMLERNDLRDRANGEENLPTSSPDLDEIFGEINAPEPLPNTNSTSDNYLNSEIDNTSSLQDSEFLFLADVPSIPDSTEIDDIHSETTSVANNVAWQSFIRTPTFTMQLAQYVVFCVIIIFTLRGIHAVFSGTKAPKAASIASPMVIK